MVCPSGQNPTDVVVNVARLIQRLRGRHIRRRVVMNADVVAMFGADRFAASGEFVVPNLHIVRLRNENAFVSACAIDRIALNQQTTISTFLVFISAPRAR
jgi:hypothetical protein